MCFFDYYCSLDYDYVYIDHTSHIGFKNGYNCKIREPLEDFHFKDKCTQCKSGCSLCGWMSVYKKENE